MGGMNSGRNPRRELVEHSPSIRAQDLVREAEGDGAITGELAGVAWRLYASGHGWRLVIARPDGVRHHHQVVELAGRPCRFGGRRWYFACPGCGRHVADLYLPRWRADVACRT